MKIRTLLFAGLTGLVLIGGVRMTVNAATDPNVIEAKSADENAFPHRGQLREIFAKLKQNFSEFREQTPLSKEQKGKIASILKANRQEIKAQLTEGAQARRALDASVEQSSADSPASQTAAERIGESAEKRALLIARLSTEIKPILTPEQAKRLKGAKEEIQSSVDDFLNSLAN